jgi:hypothetical protein
LQASSARCFVWTFLSPELTVYFFSDSRSGDTPNGVLGGTQGSLTIDGYTGYNIVTAVDGRERAGCWSHARRYLFDALPTAAEARDGLDLILELFMVERLAASGYTPIIAHPERYHDVWGRIELAATWKDAGAHLQLNGGSLLGLYGPDVRRAAFELLGRGWVDYICSDYHARGSTQVAKYRALLEAAGGAEHVQVLMQTNPSRMLDGLSPLPVAGLQMKPTLWGRVAGIFR